MPTKHIKLQKFHAEQKRIYRELTPRSVLRCGRRFGKTTLLETAGANWATRQQSVGWFCPNYKLLSPSYKRILRTLRPIVKSASKIDSVIELWTGGQIEFWTLNDPDAGRSRAYDRVIIDEGSLVQKNLQEIWEQAIAPTLLDRRGTAIMAGTPKGMDPDNYFYQACHEKSAGWHEAHAPTAMNPMLDPVGVAQLQAQYPPLVYQQEFLAQFVDWSGASFFLRDDLLENGAPVQFPIRCDAVFATIDTATKTRAEHDGTAVCYWAVTGSHAGPALVLLDYDIVQIEGSLLEVWLPTIFENLEMFARQCNATAGHLGAFIEDKSSGMVLLQQAARRGWPAQAISSDLTAVGKDERAISVSGYVYRKMVKISQQAYDHIVVYKGQSRNHFMSQVFGYRVGLKDQEDDLLDTFCYGVALALGNKAGF